MPVQAALVAHPTTPAPAVRAFVVAVRRDAARLAVAYTLEGDVAALRIPAAGPIHPGTALWRHTCFELFVAADGVAGYHELNLAPSCAWQAHAFRGYRDGGPLADVPWTPTVAVQRTAGMLALQATVALDGLSPAYGPARLRLGLSAVVEDARGALSYWALRHPSARPDFHHADGFALALEPSPGRW